MRVNHLFECKILADKKTDVIFLLELQNFVRGSVRVLPLN